MKIWVFLILAILITSCNPKPQKTQDCAEFVKVKKGQLMLGDKVYRFVGINYWYASNLAASGKNGEERLKRELDGLKKLGINNLRIQICSEGGDEIQFGVKPSLQTKAGEYNENLFRSIDFVLDELNKRELKAVLVLNNYWPWTGGMAKYQEWFGAGSIPYPLEEISGSWNAYMHYAASFYENEAAVEAFRKHITVVLNRKNTFNGKLYKEDNTIMAWQLANEPRGKKDSLHRTILLQWIKETAAFIKGIDYNHLVSIGSEGKVGHHGIMEDYEKAHLDKNIDYLTAHLWPQNWGWYNPYKQAKTYDSAVILSQNYLNEHLQIAQKLHKPLVFEEFGLARDSGAYNPESGTIYRNQFYQFVTDFLLKPENEKVLAGFNIWSFAGEGTPRHAGKLWEEGDAFTGDPPHEPQGWYSVYASDSTTLKILKNAAEKLK